jgi:hypothetical protein
MFFLMPTRVVIIRVQPPRQDKVRSVLVGFLMLSENSSNLFG